MVTDTQAQMALQRIAFTEADRWRRAGPASGPEAVVTSPGPLSPRGAFSGWSEPLTASDVLGGKRPKGYGPGKERRLYRIRIKGQQKPYYIGMVGDGDVRRRLRAHIKTYPALQTVSPSQLEIRFGRVKFPGGHVDMKLLHTYELMLQMLERPSTYNPNTWTFDDFEEMH